jgi:hypothetical protein
LPVLEPVDLLTPRGLDDGSNLLHRWRRDFRSTLAFTPQGGCNEEALPLAIGLMLAASGAPPTAEAADHKDSPMVESDPATDIADVYAFRRGDNLVVAMTVQNLTISATPPICSTPRAKYPALRRQHQ